MRTAIAASFLVSCASMQVAYYDGSLESIDFKARDHLDCPSGPLRLSNGANQVTVAGCGKTARYTLYGPNRKAMLEEVADEPLVPALPKKKEEPAPGL